MNTIIDYKSRHDVIKGKLMSLKGIRIGNKGMLTSCKVIGDNLGVAPQTVYNYMCGRIKDGYLAEAIYKELKRYKAK